MTIRLTFPNGSKLHGDDATDVLSRLGELQVWTGPVDADRMKQLLSDRAWILVSEAIDPDLPDDDFLNALDAAAVVAVERLPEKAKPRWPNTVPDEWTEDGAS